MIEDPLWPQFRWHIVATGLLLVALIVVLLIQRVERRRVQTRLLERLRFEHLIAQVSTALTGLPLGRLDEQIGATLQRVGLLLGVDRTALWRLEADRRALTLTHFWAADGVAPPPPTLPLPSSYLDSLVTESRCLSYPEPSGYPAEAEPAQIELDDDAVEVHPSAPPAQASVGAGAAQARRGAIAKKPKPVEIFNP